MLSRIGKLFLRLALLVVFATRLSLNADAATNPPVRALDLVSMQEDLEVAWPQSRVRAIMTTNNCLPYGIPLPIMRDVWMGKLHTNSEREMLLEWRVDQKPVDDAMCLITASRGTNTWIIVYAPVDSVRRGKSDQKNDPIAEEKERMQAILERMWPTEKIGLTRDGAAFFTKAQWASMFGGEAYGGLLHPGRELVADVIVWKIGNAPDGKKSYAILASKGDFDWLVAKGDFESLSGKSTSARK